MIGRRLPLALAALALLVASCTSNDAPTGVGRSVLLPLDIRPALIPSPANEGARPINRIRASAVRVVDGVLLASTVVDVDPAAEEWTISLEVRASSEPTDVEVRIFLLHADGSGETVEFSGVADPVSVRAGETVEPSDVLIVRGPLDNIHVTGLAVSDAPDTLYENESATVGADVTAADGFAPIVFWTVLDTTTLVLADSTVTGGLPGLGRIVASAGTFSDTATVFVRPAPASIVVSPDSVSVLPGAEVSFGAVVLTARGDTLPDEAVTWRSGTPSVIGSVGDGTFQAVAAGSGLVEAVSASIPTVVGTATMVVEGAQGTPSDLSVLIGTDTPAPVDGDTVQTTVRIVNGTGAGAVDATGVLVRHAPAGGSVVLASAPDRGTFDEPTGVWSVGDLFTGDTATLVLDLEMPVGIGGQSLPDSAWLAGLDQADTNAGNDTATVILAVAPRPVDVAVLKTVDEPQPLEGVGVTFTVSLVNDGDGPISGVSVLDVLDVASFTGASSSTSIGTLDGDTLWTVPLLASGDTATWTTSATVATGVAGDTTTNTAVLLGLDQLDTDAANDTALVVMNFPLSALPTVSILAPADGSVFDPGQTITFTGSATDPDDGDLTPTIQWTSNRDGQIGTGRTFDTSQLSTGLHAIAASATDSDGGTAADTVEVTVALITTPATLNVAFGGTASLPISLTEPAPSGGLTVDVTSDDPATLQVTTPSVFIAEGALSANATLSGVQPGAAEVTVFNAQFGGSTTGVTVLAELDILQGSLRYAQPFPQPLDVQLEAAGVPTPGPAGGLTVNASSADPTCVAVPTTMTIPGGFISDQLTTAYGGSATLPCTTWVRVSAPSVTPDSVQVTVDPAPGITVNSTTVGSGLQYGLFYANLETTQHGGVTVRIESSDPDLVRIAPDAQTAGTPFIEVFLPNGSRSAPYWVQGLEGVTGTATLTVSAPNFTTNSSATVDVVQPALDLVSVPGSLTSFAPDDVVRVRIGVPNAQVSALQFVQSVRAGGVALVATITSSTPGVAQVITLPDSTSPVTTTIVPGQSQSPGSVASGGAALDPIAPGTTTLSATIPGAIALPGASVSTTITQPVLSVPGNGIVGSGLQYGTYYVSLTGASQHGGTTVRIQSADPQVLLIAPNASTAGSEFIDVVVPNGQTSAPYWIQGVEGATGTVGITASAPGFTTSDTETVDVVQPAVDLLSVGTNQTTLSPEDPIWARVGVPFAQQTGMWIQQSIRIGGTPLTATIATSDAQVVDLITLPDSTAPVTVEIPVGQARSATSVAAGGVALDPLTAGSADITARIPEAIPLPTATVTVNVTAPTISVTSLTTVGSGLQYGTFNAVLGASDHGGRTVRIESTDPQTLLVSRDRTIEGTAFIDVPVADGQTVASYWVHGVEGVTDTVQVPLTVSAPGFVTNTSGAVRVVQPALDILGLQGSQTTLSPDDPFLVRTGVPNLAGTFMSIEQSVRAGAPALSVSVTSSNIGVGLLETTAGASGTAALSIAEQTARTPGQVVDGGVAFDPQGVGTATVTASATNYLTVGSGSTDVSVTAPGISMNGATVGSGLIERPGNIVLGATQHGGVTVRIESSNPSVLLVSAADSDVGAPFVDVVVPNGSTSIAYWIHGVEGQEASVNVTATADGFTNGSAAMNVVQPALDIVSLGQTHTATDADDPFQVRIGIPNGNETSLTAAQELRPGAAPLTVTVTSSAPAAAGLVTTASPVPSGSVDVTIVAEEQRTPSTVANGGVALDFLAAGSTSISATIPGFITTTSGGVRVVTINP